MTIRTKKTTTIIIKDGKNNYDSKSITFNTIIIADINALSLTIAIINIISIIARTITTAMSIKTDGDDDTKLKMRNNTNVDIDDNNDDDDVIDTCTTE